MIILFFNHGNVILMKINQEIKAVKSSVLDSKEAQADLCLMFFNFIIYF